MDIKVVGSGCDKCGKLYENTVEAVSQLGWNEQVEKVEDLIDIVKLGVMSVPALVINGKIAVAGRTPKAEEIIRILKKQREE